MSNPYYEYTAPVSPGTTIRSNKYNSDQEGIQTGFDLVAQSVTRAIKLNSTQNLPMTLPDVITDSMLLVSPTTGAGLYPMSTFTAAVQSAIDNANSALASKNAAATSESNSATSESNALTSKNAAETSASSALTSKNAAATSASNAETDASNANTSKNAAATSASNALASENAAATSASNAASSESSASTSKNAANLSATNAASSESAAVSAADTASTAATNANAHKNQAKIYRDEAEGFRDDAAQIAGGDAQNALKLGNQPPSYYTSIPSRLGYTPVQQGTGAGQGGNNIKIGWSTSGGRLLLEVDYTDFGDHWPIISSDTARLNGQLASYYAKASDVQQATTTSRGTVEKATPEEALAGTPNKFPDSSVIKSVLSEFGLGNGFPSIIADFNKMGFLGSGLYRTVGGSLNAPLGVVNSAVINIKRAGSSSEDEIDGGQLIIGAKPNGTRVAGFRYAWDTAYANVPFIELYHTGNFDPTLKADKSLLDNRLPKPAVKHYGGTGNITVDFNQAVKHVVTRLGSGNGTITLVGTLKAGDELVINNVYEDSGVATITGKAMIARVDSGGGISETTHTFTGQGELTMYAYDGGSLVVTGVR